MTRKEQKEERRKAILMTALTLFVEKGYYDTRITDIAEAVPMSTGLMFHYFKSKEELLLEVVKMGAEGTKSLRKGITPDMMAQVQPDQYLVGFLRKMLSYAKDEPWVFHMFVLMGQARRTGMPEESRQVALSVDIVDDTAGLVAKGQKDGIFHGGDAKLMSRCFWASVQGIMEEMAMDKDMKAPNPEWIVGLLR
ncbi:MAG: TetR/AcrR family transcriptional regulator [Lachnospiraceae bacterium]|nr:TetR/AcrR family transcriptional regulator [Lachnospiraceae bacterium]